MLLLGLLVCVVCVGLQSEQVAGHGMVLLPVARASRWREDDSAIPNFDDNGLFCGGRDTQWKENDGKCGMCGDNYADPTPRANELGGLYGQGVIVKKYSPGSEMYVQVLVTASHLGHFNFNMCNLDKYNKETEQCFEDVLLKQTNGLTNFVITDKVGLYNVTLQLPESLSCQHCVLQWTWTTGNSWGICDNGEDQMGCGPQEMFRTCSDIAILN